MNRPGDTARLWHRPALWALAALAAGPVLLHAPELLGWLKTDPRLISSGLATGLRGGVIEGHGGFLDPNSAWTAEDLGHVAAEQWLHGQVPWWNPLIGLGAPLAAEMQPAALFLPFILLLHFQQGFLWLHIAMQEIAGFGTYLLLRRLGGARVPALLGAVLYAATGTFAWFSHGPERVAAFLPWLLFAVELCRTRRAGAALLAAALAGAITAGWPETAYLDGLLVACWTLLRLADAADRPRFMVLIAAGLAAGLLLAAPAILPFVAYLGEANIGDHADMAGQHLDPPGIAMLLTPYINGPIAAMGRPMWVLWGNVGGYLGVAATVLALAGALGRGQRALRWMLLAWLVVGIARAAGLAPAQTLTNLIPLVRQTAFARYIPPSLAMAAAILACLAIEDWRHAPSRAKAFAAGLGTLALLAGAVWLCRPMAALLWPSAAYRLCWTGSIAWAALVGIGLAALLAVPCSRPRVIALATLVLLDTGGAYLLARVAAPRAGRLDLAPIRYLQAQARRDPAAGLLRIVSLPGGFGLNEAAWHGLSAIDGTMLPVPRAWASFVAQTLATDPIIFHYDENGAARLVRDWPALRALGVGWLVTGRGQGPAHLRAWVDPASPRRAEPLRPDRPATGSLPTGLPGQGPITTLGIDIGTYAGQADGTIRLTLTTAAATAAPITTATGTASLADAADNAPLDIPLDRPIQAGATLRWSLTWQSGQHPPALWRYGEAATPRFSTAASWPGLAPTLVFAGTHQEIYRLPDPAPFWQGAGCTLADPTRDSVTAVCPAPASLVRRALFFPGWRATLNRSPVALRPDGLFQRLDLPAGRSAVRFAYAPPGIGWAGVASLAGLLLTVGLAWPRRGRRRGAGR